MTPDVRPLGGLHPMSSLPEARRTTATLPPVPVWRVWALAIRPRTLSLAVTPVLLGTALAWAEGGARDWWAFAAALACALLIQIATNLHNDAADFERGTDVEGRIGPLRVAAAGWVSAAVLKRATFACLGAALALGVFLVERGGWPILLAGLASLGAAWAYSGGPRPISHSAWGEVFVLLFFGLVAVAGSHWLQAGWTGQLALAPWLAGAVVGLPAAAVLLVNNYRDLEGDCRAGRRTLVARLGRERARAIYALLMLLPYLGVVALAVSGENGGRPGAWLALLALPLALRLVRSLGAQPPGAWLNTHLAATAKACSLLGLLLAVGVML
jgi:1,4-dihydroxy-2-naphthoate octaprenyltransferase